MEIHRRRHARGVDHRNAPLTIAAQLVLALALCVAQLGLSAAASAQAPPLVPPPDPPTPRKKPTDTAAAAAASGGPTTPILDDFNRADEDPLSQGGAWAARDPIGGTATLKVVSNVAAPRVTSQTVSYRTTVYPGDMEAYATVAAVANQDLGVNTMVLNIRQVGGQGWDGIYLGWRDKTTGDTLTFSRVINNSTTVLGVAAVEIHAGDVLLARRVGTQLEAWVKHEDAWELKLTVTDTVLTGGMIGIGLNNSSQPNPLGRWDDFGGGALGAPPLTQSTGTCDGDGTHAQAGSACQSDPVNSLTGAFTTEVRDLQLPGIGVPFSWRRTYTSSDTTSGRLGPGWTDSYAASLAIQGNGDVILRGDEGQQVFYTKQADGSYVGARGARSALDSVAGGYELTRQDQVKYLFDTQGRLSSIKDRNNQGLTFSYNGSGLLETITDSVGRSIAVTFGGGLVSRVTLPDGRYVEYGYTNGRLSSVRDARGGTTEYLYDAGRLEKVIDQNGHQVVRNVYDPTTGRVVEQYNALNDRSTFAWDPATQTATVTDARSKQWKDIYAGNLLVERVDPLGNRTRFEYDSQLNVRRITDPRNNAVTMTYDGSGNLRTRTAPPPLSYVEEWTYNARNDPLTYKDGRGNVTDYGYDGAGNLTSVTGPDADGPGPLGRPQTLYGRDPAGTGLLASITDPRGNQTQFSYTSGNLSEIRTQLGNRTTLCYDGSGRMIGLVDPRGTQSCALPNDHRWSYTYNEHGQLRTQTDPLGNLTELEYDPAGNLSSRTDAKLHETTYGYDDANRLTSVTAPDPDGVGPLSSPMTTYGYDPVGNLQTRRDANLHETVYGYDDANRLATVTSPGNRVWTYGYDPNGNLTTLVDANGNATPTAGDGQTSYGYDVLNRLTSINYSDVTPDATFAYDGNGNRTQMTDGSGTETYAYDPLNRLTTVTRGLDVFSYAYDLLNLIQATYPGAGAVTYSYDDDERLQNVASGGQTTSYAYDAAANLRTTTLPASNGYVETRSYDRAGRVTEVRNEKGGVPLANFVITPDPVGNPLSVVRSGSLPQTQTYEYDNMDRLKSVCFQAGTCPGGSDPFIRWTYDGVGNRLTESRPTGATSYTYNVADELTQAGPTSFTYDQNGNELTAGPRTFTYDLANRLKTTTLGTTTTYAYDGDGKRLEAAGDGTPAAPTLRTPCSTATGSSGSAAVSKPTGTLAGDLLVVGLAFEKGSDVAIQAPSGWTLIRRTNQSSNVGYASYRKLAGASEPTSYSFTLTNSPKWSIGSCAIAGANATTPIDVHADASGSSGNPSAPSVTTTGPSRLLLAVYANKKAATFSNYTAPAAERWDAPNVPGGLPSNALASYTQATAGASGAKSATASEAAEWVAQQVAIAPGPSISRFLWDVNQGLPQLALERDANNSLIRRYVFGARRISQSAGSDTSYFLHDGLGSVTNLTSSAGATQWTWSYEPFGSIRTETQSGSAPANFMKFTGEYLDPSGLYHLRARQYDSQTGRFLARDPIFPPLSRAALSRYPYVDNRPTVFVDPNGKFGVPGAIVGGLIGGGGAFVGALVQGESIGDALIAGGIGAATGAAVGGFGGLGGIAAGAVIGGGTDLATQVVSVQRRGCELNWRSINWPAVAGSTVGGALSAGFGGKIERDVLASQWFGGQWRASVSSGIGAGTPGFFANAAGFVVGESIGQGCDPVLAMNYRPSSARSQK
jgi:RHS repeat-associated protein